MNKGIGNYLLYSPCGYHIADKGPLGGLPVDGADEVEEVEGLDEDVVVGLDDERRFRRFADVVEPLEAHHVLVAQVVDVVDEIALLIFLAAN